MSEYYTDNNTAGYDNNGGGNGYNKRSFNDPQQDQQQGGGYHGGKRVKKGQDGIEMRCLVPSRCAGAIIGKGGSNIKELRESFQASVFLPDGQANERVLKVSASPQNCGEVLLKVLPKLDENSRDRYNQDEEQQQQESYNTSAAIKLLVHQSQAGGIIGTKGVRIKELREKTGAFIKVHQECAGASTDRICQVSGSHDVIAECVKLIMELLETIPPKGPVYNYDPSEDMGFGGPGMDDFGYGGGFGFGGGDFGYGAPPRGGGFRGGRGGRGRGGARGRGGFGDRGGRGRGGRGGRGSGFRGGRGAQAQSHQY